MPKKSSVSFTLAAAALLAASTSPALAKGGDTRSFQSLPSAKAYSAASLRTNGFASSRFSLQTQNRFSPPGFNSQTRFGGNLNFGNGRFGGGLATLFGFLPPRVQEAIAEALGNAGPRGERLCRLLGIPECQLPDSNG